MFTLPVAKTYEIIEFLYFSAGGDCVCEGNQLGHILIIFFECREFAKLVHAVGSILLFYSNRPKIRNKKQCKKVAWRRC